MKNFNYRNKASPSHSFFLIQKKREIRLTSSIAAYLGGALVDVEAAYGETVAALGAEPLIAGDEVGLAAYRLVHLDVLDEPVVAGTDAVVANL